MKSAILFLAMIVSLGCKAQMTITPIEDLSFPSNSILGNNKGKVILEVPKDMKDSALFTIDDAFLIKNYRNDVKHNKQLYDYCAKRRLKDLADYNKYHFRGYHAVFFKESRWINIPSIKKIHSFNDFPILVRLYNAKFMEYQLMKDTVTIEQFRRGKTISLVKKKID